MFFKSKIKFDSLIDCVGETQSIPSMSGIGDSSLKKAAEKNPLPLLLGEFINTNSIGYWIISDFVFNTWNHNGENIEEVDKNIDELVVAKNELICLVRPKYIKTMIGYIAPDQVILVGLKSAPKNIDNVTLQNEWDCGNAVVVVECIDASICKICSQGNNE
jgi:hypothetical protein